MSRQPLELKDFHVAVLAAPGEESELREPIRILQEAGAHVEVLDRSTEAVSPDTYDAALVPGTAIEDDQEFLRAMRQAGKPVFCASPGRVDLRSAWCLAKEVFSNFVDKNVPRLGAALAYYTVFSIAPLLVVVVGIAGLAFSKTVAQSQIVWQIQSLVGPDGGKAIQALLDATQKPASGVIATLAGLILLFFGASGVFLELRDSLNILWGVRTPGTGLRGMLATRFFSFAMVLAVGFLLLVSLILSAALAAVGKFLGGYLPLSEPVLHTLTTVISFAVFTAVFALLYKMVPDLPVAWNDVWIGAAVTSLLFSLGKLGIAFYLGKAAIGSAYGAAGSLVVFLAWVYYSAQIFFLGAEFTHLYSTRHGSHRNERRLA
jgi:membrane protein